MTALTYGTVTLQPGDVAPDFSLVDQRGEPVSLSDFAGRRVVLFFYPKASTPGCTVEACDFRDSLDALAAAGVDVVGLSPDEPADNAAFAAEHRLTYRLLSDPEHAAIDAFGLWGEQTFGDRTFTGVVRSTFVVGSDGRLEQAWYAVGAQGHVAMVREALGL
jgi:peroxiredoxin Q/BCP